MVKFDVVPSIMGGNQDCEFNYTFDKNTNQAYVNYLYVLPEDVDDISEVVLTFTLSDSKEANIRTKVINIKNEWNFADEKIDNIHTSEI